MEKNSKGVLVAVILFFSVWIWNTYSDINELKSQVSSLEDQNSHLENRLSDYEDALSEANDNIEEANSSISDAQLYAWESYNEMGEAIDNLQEVDTISEP